MARENKVNAYYFKDPETGGCYSLRVRGLQGAAISLAIIIVAITLCHVIQSNNSQKTA